MQVNSCSGATHQHVQHLQGHTCLCQRLTHDTHSCRVQRSKLTSQIVSMLLSGGTSCAGSLGGSMLQNLTSPETRPAPFQLPENVYICSDGGASALCAASLACTLSMRKSPACCGTGALAAP